MRSACTLSTCLVVERSSTLCKLRRLMFAVTPLLSSTYLGKIVHLAYTYSWLNAQRMHLVDLYLSLSLSLSLSIYIYIHIYISLSIYILEAEAAVL